MEVDKLPVKWLQSGFKEPYKVYVGDIKTDDGVLVFDNDSNEYYIPFYISEEELFSTEEEARLNREKKIKIVDGYKEAVNDYYKYCIDEDKDSWITNLVDWNSYYHKYERLNDKIETYERILDTYHTGIMNIDGISFHVKNIFSIKFGETKYIKEAEESQKKVLLTTDNGQEIRITLHSDSDFDYFSEFFGENQSGYTFKIDML